MMTEDANSKLYARVMTLTWSSEPLLYAIPRLLQNNIHIGMLVEVPFGKGTQCGIVSGIERDKPDNVKFKIKDIGRSLYDQPLFGKDILELINWISKYYLASIKSVAEAVIPTAIRKLVNPKFNTILSINKNLVDDELDRLAKRSPKQCEIYRAILAHSRKNKTEVMQKFSAAALRSLIEKGIVAEKFVQVRRIEYHDGFGNDDLKKRDICLTDEQIIAAREICSSVENGKFCTHLLHGVTGSGKTEVYIEAINMALGRGGDVILLVPELALTPQTVARIRNGLQLYGDRVLVWHSGLSEGERRDAWLALSNGDAKIVIGARSAIFAPLKNVKLIIVDEEHESTYKQSESPRYHARDVAIYRAKLNNATCVIGSATPSLESFYNSKIGKFKLNILTKRIDGSVLPATEIVDMRCENPKNVISTKLHSLIEDRLAKREQTLLFLNRRGYATTVLCKSCNYSAQCPRCSISLTYHRDRKGMLCHLCGYEEPLPIACPICGNCDIAQRGMGSQKLEEITKNLFPLARIARIDSDTMGAKDSFKRIFGQFRMGEIDILIGTQMIAKGLDFPNISLVGVVDIDNTINFPDFRSAEKAFQLIVQVSGRAGRGSTPGKVIIQTRNPQASIIKLAEDHRFQEFVAMELSSRGEFLYPPYRHIIRLVLACEDEQKLKSFSSDMQKHLKDNLFTVEIKNAVPSILSKINGKYRYTIVIFTAKPVQDGAKINEAIFNFKKLKEIDIMLDVDPSDLV